MRIGIDIGGSHIAIAVVDGETIIEKIEYVYDVEFKNQIRKNLVQYLKNTISIMTKKYSIEMIGISLAGQIKKNTLIISPNLPELNGINFADILYSEFSIPVSVNTDSLCATKAEKEYGCLKSFSNGVFLVIGTGIGAVNFHDNNFFINEYGHMVVHRNGNLCRCGKKGCFETYGSMKALKKSVQDILGISNNSGKVIRAYLRENIESPKVQQIIDKYVDDFCMGLSNIIDITLPEVIGFGGSFSYYEDILLDKIKQKLENETLFIDKNDMPVFVMGKFKNDAGMIGATL